MFYLFLNWKALSIQSILQMSEATCGRNLMEILSTCKWVILPLNGEFHRKTGYIHFGQFEI